MGTPKTGKKAAGTRIVPPKTVGTNAEPCECDPCASFGSGYGVLTCINGVITLQTPPAGGHWVGFFNESGEWDHVNITELLPDLPPPERPATTKKLKGKK